MKDADVFDLLTGCWTELHQKVVTRVTQNNIQNLFVYSYENKYISDERPKINVLNVFPNIAGDEKRFVEVLFSVVISS